MDRCKKSELIVYRYSIHLIITFDIFSLTTIINLVNHHLAINLDGSALKVAEQAPGLAEDTLC